MPTPRSSDIEQIAYDAETMDLEVTFNSGGVYTYSGVDASTWRAFARAPSKGSFLNRQIKQRFPYELK